MTSSSSAKVLQYIVGRAHGRVRPTDAHSGAWKPIRSQHADERLHPVVSTAATKRAQAQFAAGKVEFVVYGEDILWFHSKIVCHLCDGVATQIHECERAHYQHFLAGRIFVRQTREYSTAREGVIVP